MYMGFMKMGLSLMILFYGLIACTVFLRLAPLLFVTLIVWFYSFFHARNLAALPEEDLLKVPDRYLFILGGEKLLGGEKFPDGDQRFRRIFAALLIVVGAVLVIQGLGSVFFWLLPNDHLRSIFQRLTGAVVQLAVGAGIFALGVWLIRSRKKELMETEQKEEGRQAAPEKAAKKEKRQAERSEKQEKQEKSEKPEKPIKPVRSETLEIPEKSDESDSTDLTKQPPGPVSPAGTDEAGQGNRAEKQSESGETDRQDVPADTP